MHSNKKILLHIWASGIFFVCQLVQSNASSHVNSPNGIIVIILSQPNAFHVNKANELKDELLKQVEHNNLEENVTIHLLHEEWPQPGAWTVFPIISSLDERYGHDASWILFVEDSTNVVLFELFGLLKTYDPRQEWFLGHALHDQDATIIHHYAFHENPKSFTYPDFASGFLFSVGLLNRFAATWKTHPDHLDFAIDPKHELSKYLMEYVHVNLTHVPQLCLQHSEHCVSIAATLLPACGQPVNISDMYFAVKTCTKFHVERVPVVKNTWAKDADHIDYFSDGVDPVIPSIDLNIPNTERGHCAKTLGILEYAATNFNISNKDWLVLADDDTLLSIPRLQELLSCYNKSEPIVLGERYGYGVTSGNGYNYITGGGGIVFSMTAVKILVSSNVCICPRKDTPDDMFIGICLKELGIPLVHSALFHQARPMDYAKGYLSHQIPISFHKHWMIDPLQTYREWLHNDNISPAGEQSVINHVEL